MTGPDGRLDDLIDAARHLAGAGRRSVLGITGPPGSGKSTLAAALVAALGPDAVVVPMDGFHLAQDELVRLGRRDRMGAPDTFDAAGYAALLQRIRAADETVYAPQFERRIEEPLAGSIAVAPEVPLVVTEGNYLLLDDPAWRRVRDHLDAVWYVDLDAATRVERLVARHVRHGKSPVEAREWVLRNDERNAALVEHTRARADRIIPAT